MNIGDMKVVSASQAGADMVLRSPFTGEESDCVFEVIGFDAPEVIAALREFDKGIAAKSKRPDVDEITAQRKVALTLAAVRGWRNFEYPTDGEFVDYSREFLAGLLDDPNFHWITQQVYAFGANRQNFTPKPKGGASSGQDS